MGCLGAAGGSSRVGDNRGGYRATGVAVGGVKGLVISRVKIY